MSNEQFKRNFAALLQRAGDKAELVAKKVALELGARMVMKSPVDTGRFKNNWQYGAGSINFAIDLPGESMGRISAGLSDWKPGMTIYITNSLPYARRLEHGWSKQAPAGVVKTTVLEYGQALAKVVAGTK